MTRMKKLLSTVAALCLAATTLAAQTPQRKPMVVVISLDAFGASLLHDPLLPVPALHALMQNGAYASSMQPVNPTVTWPNHTAMVTGVTPAKHGLIANGQITGQRTGGPITVEFHAPKSQLVRVPTVYEAAHAAGMTTAEMDWVAIEHAGIDYSFFEQPERDSKLIQEMLADGSLSQAELDNFRKASQPSRDRIYTRAAAYTIKHHHPNLTLLHLLALDSAEHTYGYGTPAGVVTAAFLDDRVAEVVQAVKDAGDLDRTTFLIVSDHGQSSVHHTADPNAILRDAGIKPSEATALAEGGAAYIYEAHATPELSAKIRAAFAASPATDTVPTDAEISAQGWPTPHDAGKPNPTAFDVLAYAKEDWKFSEIKPGTTPTENQTGAHGYPNTRPLMQEIFIAEGAAIKPHAGEQPPFPNLNVAATIAQILGLPQTGMDGKPVTAILK
ncbi:Predicted pyrophosphatase or phosphodiesterase, AlkP superfamily [Terriglobus roseus]|uniref:Predicted pyrophosphatase or phosphodiesterase, AlkP superfamily n=2 Tax=Terriglobus roseus TaxID=392734 RepID=A0A1H4PBZ8_9BACT|nr:Predicted pyrophosphatase or phosphodiesterase, AlkP superfamily [Terriglobus roseus]